MLASGCVGTRDLPASSNRYVDPDSGLSVGSDVPVGLTPGISSSLGDQAIDKRTNWQLVMVGGTNQSERNWRWCYGVRRISELRRQDVLVFRFREGQDVPVVVRRTCCYVGLVILTPYHSFPSRPLPK